MNHVSMLYRVPSLGGAPTKLVEDVDTAVTLSPDDKRLAFVRIVPQAREQTIIVAGVDGTGEQKIFSDAASSFKIAAQPDPAASAPAWSPDGKRIACPVRITDTGGEYQTILGFQTEDGAAKPLTAQRWQTIGRMDWLADGSGLVAIAAEQESNLARQIWYVAYPSGEARSVRPISGSRPTRMQIAPHRSPSPIMKGWRASPGRRKERSSIRRAQAAARIYGSLMRMEAIKDN
jgi:dipeptidyl aminopeptidase/acylaminoacyl peptidase